MNQKHKYEKSKCRRCAKFFDNLFKLKKHESKTHSSLNFECLICLRKFRDYEQLRSHVERIHSKVKKKIMHHCDICGVNYYSKFRLEKHLLRDHTRPFKCLYETCMKMFVSSSSRRMHFLKIHNNKLEVSEYFSSELVKIILINNFSFIILKGVGAPRIERSCYSSIQVSQSVLR